MSSETPPDDRKRPDRETALFLLASRGTMAVWHSPWLVEEGGRPVGLSTEETGVFTTSVEALGWSWAELGVDADDYGGE